MPKNVTAETLEENTAQGTVVLDLWAPWCGPCKILGPMLEELERELPGLTVLKQNVDEDKTLADRFKVQSVPTMIIFQGGKPVEKVSGVYPKAKLKGYFEQVLARV